MDNILNCKSNCVGCRSCEQRCPVHCITIKEDKEGFLYPEVNEKECINCHKCITVCPVKNEKIVHRYPKEAWAWKNKNEADIMYSASGGVADSASKVIIEQGGVVFGAAYDDRMVVRHIDAENDDERKRLRSSKYVQSDLNDSYRKVAQKLTEGKMVLFTGTPCQISGLYAFLGDDQENLFTIDLICHGVPSPKFFRKYIEYQEKKMGSKILSYNFRSKEKQGWGFQYLLKIGTKTGIKYQLLSLDRYGKHFMEGDCYRESCYQCEYANMNRVADMTVGDYWGISKNNPDFNSTKGVSCVFVNSEKGRELFDKIKHLAEIKETSIEEAMFKQHNLTKPSNRPKDRDFFYKNIDSEDFIENLNVGLQIKERIKSVIPKRIFKLLKSL